MNKPNIIDFAKINIIGYEYKTNLNNDKYFEEISRFYDDFSEKCTEFKAYGLDGSVQNTRKYIYGTWLGPDFEVTDDLNSSFPNDLKIKIYTIK